jgi:hypothetical protein
MSHLGFGDNPYHFDKIVVVLGIIGLVLIGIMISLVVYFGFKFERQHTREKLQIPTELSDQYIVSKNIGSVHMACRRSLDLIGENTAWIKYKYDKPQQDGKNYLEVQLKKVDGNWKIELVDQSDNPCNWPFDL